MNCPICDIDARPLREVFESTGALVYLSCGHRGKRNPDIGTALGWETREVFNPSIGVVEKRRMPTEVDRRELIVLKEDEMQVPEMEVNPAILKDDNEPDPTEEELSVEIPLQTPKRKTK